MLKTIIRKLEKKNPKAWKDSTFCFVFSSFKPKRFTQNFKTELKRLWVGLDNGTK